MNRRLLYVEWDDHSSPHESGWRLPEDVRNKPLRCSSVGWLMKEDKDALTLSASYSDSGFYSNEQTILKNCIKKRRLMSRKQ